MSHPRIEALPDGWAFRWPDSPIKITISRLRDRAGWGPVGELLVAVHEEAGQRILIQQQLPLLGDKSPVARVLATRWLAPWDTLLEQVAILTVREWRRGAPVESLTPREETPTPLVLAPLLYAGNATVLYGPGDSAKSFLALYLACLLQNGCSREPLCCSPESWQTLYLDWEMTVEDARWRVRLLQAGEPVLAQAPDYRRCVAPLADEVAVLQRLLRERLYDVLIVDSLAMAAGRRELYEAESAIRFFSALRALQTTSLILAHTAKGSDEQERTIYGSVFFFNLARSVWEVRRSGDMIGLFHRKNNLGPLHAPLGYRVEIDDQRATWTPCSPLEDPVLEAYCPLPDRLTRLLTQEPGLTVEQLAELVDRPVPQVQAVLRRHRTRFLLVKDHWYLT